jgi:hypothetical protein
MIEVEDKINNQPIVILIDLGDNHSYLYPKMVERFHFPRSKLGKHWMVQLVIGSKNKINDMLKTCTMDMNGLIVRAHLNITPFSSYDCLISMDWFKQNHVLDCYNKYFTFLDPEGGLRTV